MNDLAISSYPQTCVCLSAAVMATSSVSMLTSLCASRVPCSTSRGFTGSKRQNIRRFSIVRAEGMCACSDHSAPLVWFLFHSHFWTSVPLCPQWNQMTSPLRWCVNFQSSMRDVQEHTFAWIRAWLLSSSRCGALTQQGNVELHIYLSLKISYELRSTLSYTDFTLLCDFGTWPSWWIWRQSFSCSNRNSKVYRVLMARIGLCRVSQSTRTH